MRLKTGSPSRFSRLWNGSPPCVRTYPEGHKTGVSRWCGTMAITVMSVRGKRQQEGIDDAIPCILEPQGNKKSFRKNWARLIQKIYEANPLICSKCQGPMMIIRFIEDPSVIRDILNHLGLWLVRAWQKFRNNKNAKVNWQFTTEDARIKLRRLYPTLDS